MEMQEMYVGTVEATGTAVRDTRKLVRFEAEQLASYHEPGMHKGQISDLCGVNQLLFRTADGRLVIFEECWSHWQSEPTTSTLLLVDKAALGPMGRFAALGAIAGDEFTRALTLDEALAPAPVVDDMLDVRTTIASQADLC